MTMDDLALLRLMQLVSPGLPIGMYSYSQGLESAVEDGWLKNSEDVRQWIEGIMLQSMTSLDLACVSRLIDAWQNKDMPAVLDWSCYLQSYRETQELRAEDLQTGQALARLLYDLHLCEAKTWLKHPQASLATLFALATVSWRIPKQQAMLGYLWGWLENQVLCAVKLVPLGQVAGQRLLQTLALHIPFCVENACHLGDDEIGSSAFSLALASSRHEMQYSRLFRS